jgi:hypothetical protein
MAASMLMVECQSILLLEALGVGYFIESYLT